MPTMTLVLQPAYGITTDNVEQLRNSWNSGIDFRNTARTGLTYCSIRDIDALKDIYDVIVLTNGTNSVVIHREINPIDLLI